MHDKRWAVVMCAKMQNIDPYYNFPNTVLDQNLFYIVSVSRDINATRLPHWPSFDTIRNTYTNICTNIYTYTHVGAHAFARPHVVAFADIHVAFCNETVQITAARTAMHVIMNAGRLFVSVPSAGNIGHFEFSIFNALVSPFASPSSLDVSSHPSCSSSFPSTLLPLPSLSSCRARTRERALYDGSTVFAEIQRGFRIFGKIDIKVG